MADDLNGSLDKAEATTDRILKNMQGIEAASGNTAKNMGGVGGGSGGGGGGSQQVANYGAPSASGSPYGGPSPYEYAPPSATNPNFGNNAQGQNNKNWVAGAVGKTIGSLMALMPTTQETVQMGSIAERMRFYSNNMGNGGLNPQSRTNNVPLYQYSIINKAMNMGTAVGPDDASQAINAGASTGLSSGLKNFNAGGGFSGILGGAALASNLAPGIGLTGGMGVMSGINSAQSVNMLKMLGINVRGQGGATMNDLPQIIEQLYGILTKNNPNPTPQDIATSLMPGNALDSLISNYFGNDPNTRKVIIAGLVQRIKAGNLRTSGTKGQLGLTGGTTTAISSLGMRNTAEGQMIQGLTETTNKAKVGTNNLLQKLFTGFGGLGLDEGVGGDLLRGAQQVSTALTTFGGIRGGAGATILGGLLDSASAGVNNSRLKKLFNAKSRGSKSFLTTLGLSGAAAAYVLGNGDSSDSFGQDSANAVGNLSQLPNVAGSKQSTVGNQFTGAITINVSVPPGADPYAYKAALADVFS
jgi:hypothetical protein